MLVWSKNQKVRSGVRRLLAVLQGGCATEEKGKQRGVVISALGAGTVKLVGGFELVRRILSQGGGRKKTGDGEREEEEATWYVYTVLSSVQVPRRKQGDLGAGTGIAAAVEGERMDIDLDPDQPGEDADADADKAADAVQDNPTPSKTTPVLSLWITQTRLPGWADTFGEMEVVVCGVS